MRQIILRIILPLGKLPLLLGLLLVLLWHNSNSQIRTEPASAVHTRNGLPSFFNKLKNKQPVTIGYLGGSITEAAGYRVQTEKYFRERYPKSAITAVNAGVGGTGSALGAFRVGPEILQYHPELVFIEFAVNDAETDSLLLCNAVEGIVRQIRINDSHTDICFLYTVHEPMLAELQQGRTVRSVRLMERIARYYGLSSVNLSYDVLNMVNSGKLVFHGEAGKNYGSMPVFSTDGTHPGAEGHAIYTNTITTALETIGRHGKFSKLPAPLYSGNFSKTALLQPADVLKTSGWLKAEEKGLEPYLKAFPGLIRTDDVNDSIVVKFRGTYVGIGDILGPSAAGAVAISIDGEKPIIKYRFDSYCWFYRRSFYLLGPLKNSVHTITIKKADMEVDKKKIIAAHASAYGSAAFTSSGVYIGNIMIIGEKI